MQFDSKILDDFAKMAAGAAGMATDVKREIEESMKSQVEKFLSRMDLVKREEFEAVREMAVKARDENEKLAAKIAELETKMNR